MEGVWLCKSVLCQRHIVHACLNSLNFNCGVIVTSRLKCPKHLTNSLNSPAHVLVLHVGIFNYISLALLNCVKWHVLTVSGVIYPITILHFFIRDIFQLDKTGKEFHIPYQIGCCPLSVFAH